MRIKSVSARNFRKFIQPVTVTGLGNGVSVIAGDNEEGKSTIVQAIKSAFHTKYNTSATKDIQPYNSSAMPEVSVEFEIDGVTYNLRKIIGRKGLAELSSANGVFSGSEAEEKLQQLCNLPGDRKDASSSIWNVLWIDQGTTFANLKIGDSGKNTLQSALEKELGSIVAGDDGQLLCKKIKERYDEFFTATGRDSKNAAHKQTEERLAEIAEQLNAAEKQLEELQSNLEELEKVRAERKEHEENKTLHNARAAVEELRARQQEIEKQKQEFKAAEETERAESALHQSATKAWNDRNRLMRDHDAITARIKTIEDNLLTAQEKQKLASEKLQDAQVKYAELEATQEKNQQDCDLADLLDAIERLKAEIAQQEKTIERATELEKRIDEITKCGQAIGLPKGTLKALRDVERELDTAKAKLESAAIKVDLLPLDGAPETRIITAQTSINIPGWGEIVVTPGAGDLEKLEQQAKALKNKFEEALRTAGVKSIEEAEEKDRIAVELRGEWAAAKEDFKQLAPDGIEKLSDNLAREQTNYELTAKNIEAFRGKHNLPADLSDADRDTLKTARTRRDGLKQQLQVTKSECKSLDDQFRALDNEYRSLTTQKNSAAEELTRTQTHLNDERTKQSDEQLYREQQESEMRLKAAAEKRALLEQTLKNLRADSIESDIQKAHEKAEQLQAHLNSLEQRQNHLEGALQSLGKQGITADVERLRGKKEQAQQDFERASKNARAVKLLYETLTKAEQESKQQLTGPLMRRLTPYISDLFAGSKFTFDNATFSINELQRRQSEPLQNLSLGTREQISVLTRLAFAEVLAESGAPSVVILDDALVYSDQARFERMQTLLKRAAEKFQIIIMTCREGDYTDMGVPIIKLADCHAGAEAPAALPVVS